MGPIRVHKVQKGSLFRKWMTQILIGATHPELDVLSLLLAPLLLMRSLRVFQIQAKLITAEDQGDPGFGDNRNTNSNCTQIAKRLDLEARMVNFCLELGLVVGGDGSGHTMTVQQLL